MLHADPVEEAEELGRVLLPARVAEASPRADRLLGAFVFPGLFGMLTAFS
jgi:hypothetical protein